MTELKAELSNPRYDDDGPHASIEAKQTSPISFTINFSRGGMTGTIRLVNLGGGITIETSHGYLDDDPEDPWALEVIHIPDVQLPYKYCPYCSQGLRVGTFGGIEPVVYCPNGCDLDAFEGEFADVGLKVRLHIPF
jgi:hypothetical protein